MGKDKSAQRTKGNQKPSSSGRSAELLGGAKGFVGFGGLTDICYVPAASQGAAEDDSQISSEFRVALRKMSKKDTVTKIKALQEFESLCENESLDSLKTTLPFWPRLYGRLSLDNERRVREATQCAHDALCSKVGKLMAPYLKLVMPVWLLAMTDPHSPVASAAKKAFNKAFAEEKRSGVMIFCCKEIADYLLDTLTIQTAQTLSDPKTTAVEDLEGKYIRVVSCSLNGLAMFLDWVKELPEKKGDIDPKILSLLDNEKFWKHSKFKSSTVRSAWFGCIKGLFMYDVNLLKPYCELLSRSILPCLDEDDPSVLPHIWIAFLHLSVGLPECWDHCEKAESVLGRIYSVLRDGGRGCACELCPQLLPILSIIPDKILKDKTAFTIDFFKSISTSLRKDSILVNKRESSAILVALFECLKYKSIQDHSNSSLWDVLIKYQVAGLIASSVDEFPLVPKSLLFAEVGKLLLFWSNKGKREALQDAVNFLSLFWDLFLPQCRAWLAEGDSAKLGHLEHFFSALRNPFVQLDRTRSVKFAADSDDDSFSKDLPTTPKVGAKSFDAPVDETSLEKFLSETGGYICEFTLNCFEKYKEDGHASAFRLFACLLSSFPFDSTLETLAGASSGDGDPNVTRSLFLEELLLPLMQEGKAPPDSSVAIFVHLYSRMEEGQRRNLLLNLKPSLSIGCLRLLVEEMTQRRHADASAAFWLRSPQLGCRLVRATQQLCAISATQTMDTCRTLYSFVESSSLVKFVISNGTRDDLIFSLEYMNQMMKVMQSALDQLTKGASDPSQLSSSLLEDKGLLPCLADCMECVLSSPGCWTISGIGDLFCAIFGILCDVDVVASPVYERLNSLSLRSFQAFLTHSHLRMEGDHLLFSEGYFLAILRRVKAIVINEDASYRKTVHVANLVEKVLLVAKEAGPKEDCELVLDHSFVQSALNALVPTEAEWVELEGSLSPLYVCPPILFGWFYSRDFPLSRFFSQITEWNQRYVRTCLFLLELLNRLCASCSLVPARGADVGDEGEEEEAVSLGQFTRLAALCLHATSHATVMKQLYLQLNNNLISEDIEYGVSKLDSQMQTLLDKINIGNKKHIVKIIRDRCMDGSSLWCTTLRVILMKWLKLSSEAFTVVIELDDDSLGMTATKQTLLGHMTEKNRLCVLEEETAKLSSLSDDPFSSIPSVVLIASALDNLPSKHSGIAVEVAFKCLVRWRDIADHIFLFATDLSDIPWEEVSLMVNIIHLMSVVVRHHSAHLTPSRWDFILCSLSAWIQSLQEAVKSLPKDMVVAMFVCATSRCVYHVSRFMKNPPAEADADASRKESIAKLQDEWEEFFAPPINDILLRNFLLCNDFYAKERSVVLYEVCQFLSVALQPLDSCQLEEANLPPLFHVEDEAAQLKLPDKLQTLMNHLSPMLLCQHTSFQSASFGLLSTLLPSVVTAWDANEVHLDEKDDLPQRSLPYNILDTMTKSEAVVDALLSDRDAGSACEVAPHTDAYTYCVGYLTSWILALTAITHASESTRPHYSTFLRESGHLQRVLGHLSKLLPKTPHFSAVHKKGANMFTTKFNMTPDQAPSCDTIFWLACQVYISCLTQLPAAVRSWWTNVDRATQQVMDKFTSSFVSPILIHNELSAINDSNVKFDNMTVKARLGAREVIATYTIDETSMELVLRLAPNHPLSIVTLEDHKRVGVSLAEWRNWLFGLNTLLSHRNTPLLNSLEFWKRNVDQKFDGIEECFICYYVLHGTNHQIPKLLCRTCKKKFHPSCLFKWFNTSSKSTCPICRSLF